MIFLILSVATFLYALYVFLKGKSKTEFFGDVYIVTKKSHPCYFYTSSLACVVIALILLCAYKLEIKNISINNYLEYLNWPKTTFLILYLTITNSLFLVLESVINVGKSWKITKYYPVLSKRLFIITLFVWLWAISELTIELLSINDLPDRQEKPLEETTCSLRHNG